MKKYLIAHDLGTSGDKATLFSTEGEMIRSQTVPYDVHFFQGNHAEQNPEDWWQAVCTSTQKILEGIPKEDVLAISFSAQMQCCLVVDSQGTPLRPAIIWADQRAVEEAALLDERIGFERMYQLTGQRVSAGYSLEKLMWIKKHEPEVYKNTHYMLQAKDYIIFKLTGIYATDFSDASGTNALDLKNLCWSDEILAAAEIDVAKLPPLLPSTKAVGMLTPDAATLLGLTTNTQVICGGGDGPCSALGAGCIEPDELFLTFGTSAWIGGTTDQVFLDKEKIVFCFAHVIPGKYMPCAAMQAAGSAYSYIKNALCQEDLNLAKAKNPTVPPYEVLNQMVASSPVGAKDLIFLPYLLAERSPRWNPNTSASFIGIHMNHQKEDYIRAVLEGVAMNLDVILSAYRQYLPVDHMILTGGGAKGDILSQILADVLSVSLTRPNYVEEATSIAAAVIAGVGCGVFKDCSEVTRFLKFQEPIQPIAEHGVTYERLKPIFNESYQALLPIYESLSALNNN